MSVTILPSPLVTATWLFEHLDQSDLVVLDASWFLPGTDRDPVQEWKAKRIPDARYFDFDTKIADPDSDLPHMLPNENQFSQAVSELGIAQHATIVVYDSQGVFSAPRVWWMFRAMGHNSVAVLDGGLPGWEAAGYPLESGEPVAPQPATFRAVYQPEWVIDADTLHQQLEEQGCQVLDARPAARFYGTQPEPRAGIRCGHMPQAKSLPFTQLVKAGYFLDVELLRQRFDALSDQEQQLIFTCGSGVTACTLALAAELAGRKRLTVYDGSWSEWGSGLKYPVVQSGD
ncbi:sulfurtransferase [Photobacterium atrarenae]|uniref:Rhodanese-like domain-containing protein n=1 Tax=Photobacterium atrarenae TaxID=865757 RepID=A0ABY5GLU5_9GAMM|nr:rhodanese-like domain-containing protein [Photobacterium atrarenae]UTV30089.1 rhodanese-like domain-containing protein [Photobacterium atrarenae]